MGMHHYGYRQKGRNVLLPLSVLILNLDALKKATTVNCDVFFYLRLHPAGYKENTEFAKTFQTFTEIRR